MGTINLERILESITFIHFAPDLISPIISHQNQNRTKNSIGDQSSGSVNCDSYFKNENQEEVTPSKQKKQKSENSFEHKRASKSRKALSTDTGEMESTESLPNSITECLSNNEKETINDFTKLKEELHPFSNKKNQSQKLDNTTPQESYAEFAGKVLFYYYKCAQECPRQECPRVTRQEQPFELPNNSSEN